MSNKTFWNKENEEDGVEDSAQKILDELDEYEVEEEEKVYKPSSSKKSVYDLDSRESSVVNSAMLRLEQARLYDMLIKHDLFKGVKANPKAIQAVQNELKSYIVQRLEILLGLKKEKTETLKKVAVEAQFNDVEVEFLKALSIKGTKGASLNAPTKQLRVSEEDEEQEFEEEQGLQALDQEDEEEEFQPFKPSKSKEPVNKKVFEKKQVKSSPVSKPPKTDGIKRKFKSNEISDDEAIELAKEDIKREKRREVQREQEKNLSAADIVSMNNKKRPPGYVPIQPYTGVSGAPSTQSRGDSNSNTALGNILSTMLTK